MKLNNFSEERKKMSKLELKPCPFCGAEEIHVNRVYIYSVSNADEIVPIVVDEWADLVEVNVTCLSCGLGGYTEETEEEAIEAWNKRA